MNKEHKKVEHGTTKSYIIGFLLSLLFTIIPYYLVVNKSVKHSSLIATLLSFAVLQMAVQVFFFLHLGRGPKPLYNIFFFVGTVSLILVVVIGSIFIIDNLNYNMSPADVTKKLSQDEAIYEVNGSKTGACQKIGTHHRVTISKNVVSPSYIDAKLCDTLTFINEDSITRLIAFGPHAKHIYYGGETEITVHKNYAKTITLNQLGTYTFHDHDDESVTGSFAVTQ